MALIILTFLFFFSRLISSEICVVNEVDIYTGYDSALATGSIMKYGESAMLVAGRNEDGYHLFSYSKEREERLQVVVTFSNSSNYWHVNPFFDVFDGINAALYQVYESVNTKNVALFYTYGELDSLKTVQIDTSPNSGVSGVVEHKNELYGWNTKNTVYLFDLQNGTAIDITPSECLYPIGMRTFFNDEIMVLLCANDTEFSKFNTVCDQFIFNDTEKTFEKRITIFCPADINTQYTESGDTVYYPVRPGIFSTNFVDDDVEVNDFPSSTLKIGDHVLVEVVQYNAFNYSLLSSPENVIISLNKPIGEYFIHNNIAYFASNCDGNAHVTDVLCMFNLDTLELDWVDDIGDRIGISGFFLIEEILHFIAADPNLGTELFFLDTDMKIKLAADIYRGPRSGRPTNFIFMGDDIYFIGEDIYFGREMFTFIEKDTCGDGTVVIYCGHMNSQCVITTTSNVTYVGDIVVNITSIFSWTNTIEGNLFVNNATLTLNGTTNILGSVLLTKTTVLSVSSSDLLNVRECINPADGILELRLTDEERKLGRVTVLPGSCIVGSFGSFQSEDPCEEITVIETDYNVELSITFSVTNTCTRNIIVLTVCIAAVVLLVAVFLVVILNVKTVRQAILPHRDRGRERNAKKPNRETIKKNRVKRASSSSTPKKSSRTSTSLA